MGRDVRGAFSRSVPRTRPWSAPSRSAASSISASAGPMPATNAAPASVSRTLRVVREQRLAEPGLHQLHRVAHRGRAQAQVVGRGREAAAPVHGEHDRQMQEQGTVHS